MRPNIEYADMLEKYIKYIASRLIGESTGKIVVESEVDVNEENISKVCEFLDANAKTIRSGMRFIEEGFYSLGFEKGLEKMGFELVVKPGSKLNEYKSDPTQTSAKEKSIHITEAYLDANPGFTDFDDEYGWSYHEFVHALIFSGNMPRKYLDIGSPFGYPMNTDEIYTFGFQIRHIAGTPAYGNLMRYEAGKIAAWADAFDKLRKVVSRYEQPRVIARGCSEKYPFGCESVGCGRCV